MTATFRNLRTQQLDRALAIYAPARSAARPQRGWLRAIREASGVTLRETASRMRKSPTLAAKLEKSEAEYRITLASLREAAEALGCDLVYALVPKEGSLAALEERRAREFASENVRAVEHSMALEDQAVGGVEAKIAQETQRILKNRKGEV